KARADRGRRDLWPPTAGRSRVRDRAAPPGPLPAPGPVPTNRPAPGSRSCTGRSPRARRNEIAWFPPGSAAIATDVPEGKPAPDAARAARQAEVAGRIGRQQRIDAGSKSQRQLLDVEVQTPERQTLLHTPASVTPPSPLGPPRQGTLPYFSRVPRPQ